MNEGYMFFSLSLFWQIIIVISPLLHDMNIITGVDVAMNRENLNFLHSIFIRHHDMMAIRFERKRGNVWVKQKSNEWKRYMNKWYENAYTMPNDDDDNDADGSGWPRMLLSFSCQLRLHWCCVLCSLSLLLLLWLWLTLNRRGQFSWQPFISYISYFCHFTMMPFFFVIHSFFFRSSFIFLRHSTVTPIRSIRLYSL